MPSFITSRGAHEASYLLALEKQNYQLVAGSVWAARSYSAFQALPSTPGAFTASAQAQAALNAAAVAHACKQKDVENRIEEEMYIDGSDVIIREYRPGLCSNKENDKNIKNRIGTAGMGASGTRRLTRHRSTGVLLDKKEKGQLKEKLQRGKSASNTSIATASPNTNGDTECSPRSDSFIARPSKSANSSPKPTSMSNQAAPQKRLLRKRSSSLFLGVSKFLHARTKSSSSSVSNASAMSTASDGVENTGVGTNCMIGANTPINATSNGESEPGKDRDREAAEDLPPLPDIHVAVRAHYHLQTSTSAPPRDCPLRSFRAASPYTAATMDLTAFPSRSAR